MATAGHDTTSYALAGGLAAILSTPGQWESLRTDPSLAANGSEEVIRYTSPVRHLLRYATTDTEVAGVGVAEGERVLLCDPSANRDEAVFDDPDRFELTRANADRMASFGGGAHFCLGAQFARREVRTMLARLASELDGAEVVGPVQWAEANFVSGVKHLPLRYHCAHRR